MKDGSLKVIDFKTSTKPKKVEWIEDYYLQISAYAKAYENRYNKKVNGAEIWIAVEETGEPQKFILNEDELYHYYGNFLDRLEAFYELGEGKSNE
jgi:genome maintenance exonuclease 1